MNTISMAIVDDEALIVSLLVDFFQKQKGIKVCLTSQSGEEFIDILINKKIIPNIVLLDLKMKEKNGIEVMTFLKEHHPSINTIIMSSHYKKSFIGFMLKTGVSAFIPKGISPQKLLEIVREVKQKGYYFMPEQLDVIREQVSARAPHPTLKEETGLSKREIEILRLICFQKTAKEIGEQLFIAQRTVEGHKNNLYLKTQTKNLAGLVIYAIQKNIIKVDEVML